MIKKSTRRISIRQEKICNICGSYALIYSILDNAPVCEECVPVKKMKKMIPNEANMINSILNQKLER